MSKELNEMSDIITRTCENKRFISSMTIAEKLYNAGYRKQSDVAREIFEEIRDLIRFTMEPNSTILYAKIEFEKLAELKKKYTGDQT